MSPDTTRVKIHYEHNNCSHKDGLQQGELVRRAERNSVIKITSPTVNVKTAQQESKWP